MKNQIIITIKNYYKIIEIMDFLNFVQDFKIYSISS